MLLLIELGIELTEKFEKPNIWFSSEAFFIIITQKDLFSLKTQSLYVA